MMKTNRALSFSILTVCFLTAFANNASAAKEICFKDKKEFDAVKSELPALLQKQPLTLESNSMLVTGGLKAVFAGNRLKILGTYYTIKGTHDNTSDYVQKVCVNAGGTAIRLMGRSTYNIKLVGEAISVTTADGTASFKRTSEGGYSAAVNRALSKITASTGNK